MEKCFLCSAVNFSDSLAFECVQTSKVPSSQKSIYVVLTHLAKLIKATINLERGAKVCFGCFDELSAYDSIMVNLMVAQKKLTQQLKTALAVPPQSLLSVISKVNEEVEIPMPADNEEFQDTEVISEDDFKTDEKLHDSDEESDDEDFSASELGKREQTDDEDYIPSKKKRKKQDCETCGKSFSSKFQLQNHITETHNSGKTFNCTTCGKSCKDEEYLELHMNTHEGKTENDCRYCPKRFSRPVNTLRHMRMHWDKKKYQCEKCGVRFSQDHLLYNHRLRHEAEENPIICSTCNMSFKSRKTYNHHMLIHQENRPRHYCSLCPKSFTERYTLKMHMKTHSSSVDSVISTMNIFGDDQAAEEIDKTNETEGAVTLIMAENDNTTFCVICNINFQCRKDLDNHLQIDHDVVFK